MNKLEEEFLFFYMEQTSEEMRHLENLREKVTILVITLASAIAGFIVQQKFADGTIYLILLIIALGLFGFFMILKIFQLHQMGQRRLNRWYEYISNNCGENPQILKLKQEADNENKLKFQSISKIPHNYFWATIHLFVIFAGFCLLFVNPKKEANSEIIHSINILLDKDIKVDTIFSVKDTSKIN